MSQTDHVCCRPSNRQDPPTSAHGVEYDGDDDEQVAYWRAQRERRQEQRHAQLDKAKAAMATTTAGVAGLGLELVRKSEYHYHVLRGRQVIAQWWPSSGKTMDGQRRGQMCRTGNALVAWLRDRFGKEVARAR